MAEISELYIQSDHILRKNIETVVLILKKYSLYYSIINYRNSITYLNKIVLKT